LVSKLSFLFWTFSCCFWVRNVRIS